MLKRDVDYEDARREPSRHLRLHEKECGNVVTRRAPPSPAVVRGDALWVLRGPTGSYEVLRGRAGPLRGAGDTVSLSLKARTEMKATCERMPDGTDGTDATPRPKGKG